MLRNGFSHSINVKHRLLLWDFREAETNSSIDENGFSLGTNWSLYLVSFTCLKESPTIPKNLSNRPSGQIPSWSNLKTGTEERRQSFAKHRVLGFYRVMFLIMKT